MTTYKCILADPPWSYNDRLRMSDVKRSAGDQYRVMPTNKICGLTHLGDEGERWLLDYRIADDAILWLWVTNPFLLNGDGPRVCRTWGFQPKQLVTWVKGRIAECVTADPDVSDYKFVFNIGMGHHTRGATEHIILATRGKSTPLITDKGVPNVIIAPRRTHSQKPEEAYELIERAQGKGPRLEMFARQRRAGWDAMGDEL